MVSEPIADSVLVTRSLHGDAPAFEMLVRRHERSVRAMAWSVLHDHHLASDAAQDAFVEAYRGLQTLKDRNAFGGWVATIARNRALRMARGRRTEVPLTDPLAPAPPMEEELLAIVAALPEQERDVVMLKFLGGYGAAEIGTMLQRSTGTVTKQLSRAYERLRAALRRELQR